MRQLEFKVKVTIDEDKETELKQGGMNDSMIVALVQNDVRRWTPRIDHSHLILDYEVDPC